MQDAIYQRCGRTTEACDLRVCLGPNFPKEVEPSPLALGAGAMPGRQGRGFVKEKQLGVVAGGHDGAIPVLEGEKTDDPTMAPKRAADPAVIVM